MHLLSIMNPRFLWGSNAGGYTRKGLRVEGSINVMTGIILGSSRTVVDS